VQNRLPGARPCLCGFYPYWVLADTHKKYLAFLMFLFKHRFQPFKRLIQIVNPVSIEVFVLTARKVAKLQLASCKTL
jgi:hypothetical protein